MTSWLLHCQKQTRHFSACTPTPLFPGDVAETWRNPASNCKAMKSTKLRRSDDFPLGETSWGKHGDKMEDCCPVVSLSSNSIFFHHQKMKTWINIWSKQKIIKNRWSSSSKTLKHGIPVTSPFRFRKTVKFLSAAQKCWTPTNWWLETNNDPSQWVFVPLSLGIHYIDLQQPSGVIFTVDVAAETSCDAVDLPSLSWWYFHVGLNSAISCWLKTLCFLWNTNCK